MKASSSITSKATPSPWTDSAARSSNNNRSYTEHVANASALRRAVQVDHVNKIGNDRLVHFEAITSWHVGRVPKLAIYRFLVHQKFALPMDSYLVLMAEKYAPRTLPERIVYEEQDGFRIETPYRVIRLWEIDPAIAFEPGCEALLPWVPALNSDPDELVRATEAIQHLSEHPEQAPMPSTP